MDYASDKGLAALKAMINLASSPAFKNGSSIDNGTNIGAIVDGTWDAAAAQALFGDNYAAAKLPTFTVDGKSYQMGGFSGNKLLGVKPQTDAAKLKVCQELAKYLTSEEVQLARFNAVEWGPSNLKAQQASEVQSNAALKALAEQMPNMQPQGQYPGDYWTLGTSLGDDIINGTVSASSSDDALMEVLNKFQSTCESYVQ